MSLTDTTTEPDLTQTSEPELSRRKLLATASSGLAAALAGCSSFTNTDLSNGESPPPTPTETTSNPHDPSNQNPGPIANTSIRDITTTETTLKLFLESARPESPVKGEIVVYSSPTRDHNAKTEIGRTSLEQSSESAKHSINIDPDMGYGQQFHIGISLDAPTTTSEEIVTTTRNALVPFHNEVEGEDMLRVSTPRPDSGAWRAGSGTINQVELWMEEPEESPFDVPAVYTEYFDPDWYSYRDIEVTALVRFATFQDYGGGGYDTPRFEWVKIHFNLSEWEMLESFRWNSIATQWLETAQVTYGDGGRGEVNTPRDGASMIESDTIHMQASESMLPFRGYNQVRNQKEDAFSVSVNPYWFAASRPFCKRVAQEFERALDNPSFNMLDGREYYTATALKTFIGGATPYGYSIGAYNNSPAEAVENWFTRANGDTTNSMNECVGASAFFAGVGAHLLDTPIAFMIANGDGILHALPGLLNFEVPEHLPHIEHMETGEMPGTVDTGPGEVALCEATKPRSTIGWENGLENRITTRIQTTELNTHIPRNDDLEPAEGGELYLSEETSESEVENLLLPRTSQLTGMSDVENF